MLKQLLSNSEPNLVKNTGINQTIKEKKSPSRLPELSEIINFDEIKLRVDSGLYAFWDSKRLRWGMLLLMILAPLSKFFYLLLPEYGIGEYLINFGSLQILNTVEGLENGWYFNSFYMYFFSIGELMAPVLSIFGIFLLFPKKYYPAYLVGVPFGYYFSMLIHRMFYVTDYESFHSGATTTMTLAFLLLGIVFFIVSDNVLFRQNHRKRAAQARIIGLINMPGMQWNEKEEIIRNEVADAMKVDNEKYIKESA
jgi:hypothetical protein